MTRLSGRQILDNSITLIKLIASGTRDATTFLRGDGVFAEAGDMKKTDNLAGLGNNATARANIGLGNVDNTSDVNKPVSTAQALADTATLNAAKTYSDTQDTSTLNAAKTYADGLVVGLLDDRGSYNASSNVFPSTGGSGTAGAILKGDMWFISVAGTLGGVAVEVGDSLRALVDSPGQTASNWSIIQVNINYVPENVANKATTMTGNTTSNTIYLTAKAIYDWATGLFATLTGAQALTNKTIALGSNTISGTKAQFDAACTDGDFAYQTDLSNYTPAARTITINGTTQDLSVNRNWSIGTSVKCGVSTGAIDTTQVINHGLGKVPTMLLFDYIEGTSSSDGGSGFYDGTNQGCSHYAGVSTTQVMSPRLTGVSATVTAMGATSFTLTWVGNGTSSKYRWTAIG